jgi:hypothetical protein
MLAPRALGEDSGACIDPCDADFNSDGVVDGDDLGALLRAWGRCTERGDPCPFDFNDDGAVDGADLGNLLLVFSATCDAGFEACDRSAGDCCVAHAGIGCEDPACCEIVCGLDPFCCEVQWDSLCADEANIHCIGHCTSKDNVCDLATGNCCEPQQGVGCGTTFCCEIVCGLDPFCCEVQWDAICADAANSQCGDGCGTLPPNDCCTPGLGPGCNDHACMVIVCQFDPFCCDVVWDTICANEGALHCPHTCGDPSGCCLPTFQPGCDDARCQALICAADPFCCETAWDHICAEAAKARCAICGG